MKYGTRQTRRIFKVTSSFTHSLMAMSKDLVRVGSFREHLARVLDANMYFELLLIAVV